MLVSLPWDLSRYEPLSLQPYLSSGGVEDASALAHFLSVDNLISFLLFPFLIVENYSRRLLRHYLWRMHLGSWGMAGA